MKRGMLLRKTELNARSDRHPKTAKCQVCGTAITAKAKVCGTHRWTLKRKPRERPCQHCQTPFIPYPSTIRKFCSRECWRAAVEPRPMFLDLTCTHCGESFRRTRAATARVRNSFCSLTCATTYNSGERSEMWRGGEKHRRGPGWTVNRQLARERDKVCRLCGKTPEENGQALSVDHLIPWRMFDDEMVANDLSNLISLCRKCHAIKTGSIERKYIKGDVLDFRRHLMQIGLPDIFEVGL